jgi:hypothetical protein
MQDFQELADEAFADLLAKHGRPTDLKTALRESVAGMDKRPPEASVKRGAGRKTAGNDNGCSRMGVRTRRLDIKAAAAKLKADGAARVEAELVIDRWNRRLATGRDMLWSPTIRAALLARAPRLDGYGPAALTSREIDSNHQA